MNETGIEIVRLAGAEIDDQAIAEISALLDASARGVEAAAFLRLSAADGGLMVARRACGLSPEIVGVAGFIPDGEAGVSELIATDPAHAGPLLARELRQHLRSRTHQPSLFRGRDRAPIGFVQPSAA